MGLPRKGLKIFVSSRTKAELSKSADKSRTVSLTMERTASDGSKIRVGYSAFLLASATGQDIEVIGSSRIRPGLAFYGPFGDKDMGFKLLYSGEQIINVTPQPNGQLFQLDQDGVTDGNGDKVPGYVSQGFARVNVKCPNAHNYLVGTGLGE
jgi:hypothetical protein